MARKENGRKVESSASRIELHHVVRPWSKVTRFEKATSERVARHIPLVKHMIRLYDYGETLDYDEKLAAGMVGIAVALERFEDDRNAKLGTWLAYQIDKAIRNETRAAISQRRGALQLNLEYGDPIDERRSETIDELEEREERETLEKLAVESIETLDPRSRRVIRGLFFEGKSQEALGAEFGVSQSWISKIAKAALAKLRREIARRRVDALELSRTH